MNNQIRILEVLPNLSQTNGVSSFVMNYIEYINKDKFIIDIIASDYNPSQYYLNYCKENGIKVFLIPDVNQIGVKKYYKNLKNFFDNNKRYDIMHCHISNLGMFYLRFAKKQNIPVRILHSHATQSAETAIKLIRNTLIQNITVYYANEFVACSFAAGKYLFKKRKFQILNNAIDYRKYTFKKIFRDEVLDKYKLSEKNTIVGFSGRLCQQKNIMFLLELIKNVIDNDQDFKFFIIGNGPLQEKTCKYITENKLSDNIIYLSEVFDMYKYYSAFDIFVLPSKYEGLPVVGIESQISGCKTFFSDRITPEVKISSNTVFLNINNTDVWVKNILENKNIKREPNNVLIDKYDVEKEVKKVEEFYLTSLNNKI